MLDLLLQPYTVGEVIPLQARGILLCLVRYSKCVTKSRNIFRCFLNYPSDGWSNGVYRGLFCVGNIYIYNLLGRADRGDPHWAVVFFRALACARMRPKAQTRQGTTDGYYQPIGGGILFVFKLKIEYAAKYDFSD